MNIKVPGIVYSLLLAVAAWAVDYFTTGAGAGVRVVADAVAVRNRPSLRAEMVAVLRRGARFCVDAVYSADWLIWLLGAQGWVIETTPDGERLVEKETDADRETAAICQ